MPINDGGPAFPQFDVELMQDGTAVCKIHDGMSLRAWLAGTIAAGMRANSMNYRPGAVAVLAVEDADAIIAELERTQDAK